MVVALVVAPKRAEAGTPACKTGGVGHLDSTSWPGVVVLLGDWLDT